MTKLAIITGASRGIGLATAERFIAESWQVLNISRSKCPNSQVDNLNLDFTADAIEQQLSTGLATYLQDKTQVALVHNAAIHWHDSIDELQAASLEQTLQANIIVPSILNRLVIPSMQTQSAIIYIGSTLSEMAVPGAASYTVSKHAVVGMMRATCQDLGVKGLPIHTCCICPGFTNTEMMRAHVGDNPEILASIKARVGANRLLEPQEIAAFIYFCSQNPAINGSVLHAHLGQLQR